ncbi:MAG TPA: beta-propeller fold lactonase family protein [Gemmatimonadales bacterium]|nr:beta-propeller fold lactonase family protein [Gemmatimonadales bacterium]
MVAHLSRRWIAGPLLTLSAVAAAGCSDTADPTSPALSDAITANAAGGHGAASVRSGAVYLMTNAAGPNEVLVFHRAADGSLTAGAPVATGGDGTGSGLGNQGALALTNNGRILLVVNAGSDNVSSFRVTPGGLELAAVASSGGDQPISLTVHGNLVYVLNAGSPNSISALRLGNDGSLDPIAGSSRPLSGANVGPAQVGFSPDGNVLAVTEKGTNLITTYSVGPDGLASAPTSFSSATPTPFGFSFDRKGHLIVSEAVGGATDAATVSSYAVSSDGSLTIIDGAVPTTETAACWIAISANSRFAYTTNTGSGTLSGFSIDHGGNLTLLDADGVTGDAGTGSRPLDAAFSSGGRYLYVLASGASEIVVFAIDAHGGLTELPGVSLPAGANGMAAQ